MRDHFIKSLSFFAALLLTTTPLLAQKEFFRSGQQYSTNDLDKLYASVALQHDLLIFNAPDYMLYAYNKKDGSLQWSTRTGYKTSVPVFANGDTLFAALYSDNKEQTAMFDIKTGKLIRKLPFGPLQTKPLIRNGMLYGTAIYNFGCIIGYDMAKDTVTWSHFIAHGYSTQPYFFQDKIVANAEGDNWINMGYDGTLLDTTCAEKADMFVQDIPCIRKFKILTHDGRELTGKLAESLFEDDHFGTPQILTTKKLSFVFYDGKLAVLGDKLKKKFEADIAAIVPDSGSYFSKSRMLQVDDQTIWLLYKEQLVQYDHKKKELVKLVDLTNWQPYQVLLEGNNVWLVSGKDGLLYGLSL